MFFFSHFPHFHIFLCSSTQPPAGAAVQAGEGAEAGEAGDRGGQGGGSSESPSKKYCYIFFREILKGCVIGLSEPIFVKY